MLAPTLSYNFVAIFSIKTPLGHKKTFTLSAAGPRAFMSLSTAWR